MDAKAVNRKEEILNAAMREFINEGVSGARTQAIADNIGVTKAMIHYYFNTKENLFKEVFRHACETIMDGLMDVLDEQIPLFEKIEKFIDQVITRFEEHPEITGFVINELNSHREITEEIFRETYHFDMSVFSDQLQGAAESYKIAPVAPEQVVGNILSLCVFPYGGREFLKQTLLIEEENDYEAFLTKRREVIKDTIINWLAG